MSGGGIRVARNLSAGAVAAIAAWSSYSHMVHVALGYQERPQVAYALPFSVDGMLIVATVVMVDDKRRVGRVRPIARLAFTAGMIASIAANIAAAHPSLGARIVDAWPALALLLVVEMLARPPEPAHEVPPVPAAGPQPPTVAEAAPQPPQPQVPPHLSPPAVTHPATLARPTVPQPHPPAAPVTAAQQPNAASVGRSGSPARAATANLPDLHEQTGTPVEPAPTPRQPVRERPPAAESVAPHHNGQLPPARQVPPVQQVPAPQQVPPVQEVPPAVTAAEVPADVDPPRPAPSAPARRRNPAADTGGAGRRTAHHDPAGSGGRRPTATTLHLARQILDAEPDLPRSQVAARLGVSTRRLREVLATAA